MFFFSRIGNTWELMGASWELLKKDKELLLFPVFSTFCCLLVSASFAAPFYFAGGSDFMPPTSEAPVIEQITYYGICFIFYFINFFVITYFNAAIIGAAIKRMMGDNPTLGDAFKFANRRLPQILGWALVAATVGLILRIIEDRSEKLGAIVSGLLGAVWALTSFLVIPILVVEGVGPLEALKKSTKLLKKTWGEQLMSHFGFGVIFFLMSIPFIALLIGGVFLIASSGSIVLGGTLIAVAFLSLMLLGIIQTCLQSIFQAAVYVYARKGHVPGGFFGDSQMQNAIQRR